MEWRELLVAILAGLVQGIGEWLPISSEGNLSMLFAATGVSAEAALELSLFLHLGTTVAAAIYYREDVLADAAAVPGWRPASAFEGSAAEASFVVLATIATGLVGVPLYLLAVGFASELTGGLFVAAIGVLLVLTGGVQRTSGAVGLGDRDHPSAVDAVLVGAAQGLAVLPGVSRSGTTTSVLLFEGYDGPAAFRLSFLLSIPAGVGAVALVLIDGGLPAIGPGSAALALAVSVLVGYLAIDALLALVERIPFWAVCVGLGGLAILGGGVVVLVSG